jgi:hypothetical protein
MHSIARFIGFLIKLLALFEGIEDLSREGCID